MYADDYGHVDNRDERSSQLILSPFSTFENFCSDDWIGREQEWFSLHNIMHWTMSYISMEPAMNILVVQPSSSELAKILTNYYDEGQITTFAVEMNDTSIDDLVTQMRTLSSVSIDLMLVVGLFSSGASQQDESTLLRTCHWVLKDGGHLLATFPLQDRAGSQLTARNLQFLDTAAARYEQQEVTGCDGITHFLSKDFWASLRKQGRPAFDTFVDAFSQISDAPETLWMSQTAFYAAIKR
jgi:hypothetical protein